MNPLNTLAPAVVFDSTLAEVLGPYGLLSFLAVAGALFGVTLAILVRGIVEQIRGPASTVRRTVDAPTPRTPVSAT